MMQAIRATWNQKGLCCRIQGHRGQEGRMLQAIRALGSERLMLLAVRGT